MATVKLTPNICNHIEQAVSKPFLIRMEQVKQDIETDAVLAKMLHDAYISPDLQALVSGLKEVSRHRWFAAANHLKLRVKGPMDRVFTVTMPQPIDVHQQYSSWDISLETAEGDPIYAHIKDRIEKIVKLKEENERLREELLKPIFDTCSTLKQALIVWPSILDFVPSSCLEKHRAVAVTAKRTREKLEAVEVSDTAKHLLAKSRLLST